MTANSVEQGVEKLQPPSASEICCKLPLENWPFERISSVSTTAASNEYVDDSDAATTSPKGTEILSPEFDHLDEDLMLPPLPAAGAQSSAGSMMLPPLPAAGAQSSAGSKNSCGNWCLPLLIAIGAQTPAGPINCSSCFSWLSGGLSGSGAASQNVRTSRRQLYRRVSRTGTFYSMDTMANIGLIGCGAFGGVTLVKCSILNSTFALKQVSKGLVMQRGMERAILCERQALKKMCSPFVVELFGTFDGGDHLCFLMEVAMGGDLCNAYSMHQFIGSEIHGKFYVACAFRALEHLHSRCVVYRDLKMENIVLDKRGYAKLCDFGLAKILQDGAHCRTICGTQGYMAPEVATGEPYAYAADWWCLGILLHELMVGTSKMSSPPSDGCAQGLEPEWMDLVHSFCQQVPEQRLPMMQGGTQNVEGHPWYSEAEFDWHAHLNQEMRPPYVPTVRGDDDLRNFCACWLDMPDDVTYVNPGTGWEDAFAH